MAQLFLWLISGLADAALSRPPTPLPRIHLFMLITAADRTPLLAGMAGKPDAPTRQDCLASATERKFQPIYLQQSEP